VMDCLDTTWLSSSGKYLQQFEAAFGDFCGTRHALACSNGTAAIHLALMALGIGPGDEVIVPTLTFVASANAVVHCGARPVFVDSEPTTWNMDGALIEAKLTARTKAIMTVPLYGHPVDMEPILTLASKHGLFVIEDAAQAHGSEYKGRRVGSLGDIAAFSFFGNKIITTGEGGMVVTDDDDLASRVRQLRGHGMDPDRRYWFPIIGYNYRMTNVSAAIGLAQLEKVDWHIERRLEVASWYREELRDVPGLTWQIEPHWGKHAYWMFTVMIDEGAATTRDELMGYLHARGVESRPVFYPLHVLPPYCAGERAEDFRVAEGLARRGLNLPTWAGLDREDVRYVCRVLVEGLGR
jgi:perosamine synthetase